ncbi:RdRP-domain-containing protein [Dendrothele bispora CBS 962.96]|uniref:RNA-dependent RNA polymerase n=1 Tax=Dendrothele bispora (strain CBS 962.96) TaxID=1314807 RepID=A0A4S8M3M9_DENBC|nr:RdRP-domain-containing protein [Dendrothele bispora CBS 962.96]
MSIRGYVPTTTQPPARVKKYGERLQLRKPSEDVTECFDSIRSTFTYLPPSFSPGYFPCYHVSFTPTRLRLEGPYAMQSNRSNRIIRRYDEHKDHFIRVDFRDEEGLSYCSAHCTMDGQTFLENRVGDVLKNGFELAGRRYRFQFLAYSSSGLGEHSVWFIQPFVHPQEGLVTAQTIRDSIIDPKSIRDYQDTKVQSLLKQPSKYAARLGLAFTATVPSVKIGSHEWTEVPDIQSGSQVFSDGIGTISETLGNRVWKAICHEDQAQNAVQPSAYMVRFLGYKGIVSVDKELDNVDGNVHMRLRESMRKFPGKVPEEADIEIAHAFLHPNKALVTVLEDRGVSQDAFLELQSRVLAEIDNVDKSIADCHRFLRAHSLGRGGFDLARILEELKKFDCDFKEKRTRTMIDNSFFKELRAVAKLHVAVRDMRLKARIYLPDSYHLVGVADEGPVYRDAGYDNIYILPEAHIYACIQEKSNEDPDWLEGSCTISRSPITHPGDVQRVHAIGKPPEGMRCLFGHMKNVVVLPSVGRYSLASCLGGGDLDGDMFSVIMCPELLPPRNAEPADYSSMNPYEIKDRECDVNDICDFVVQYINSDVLAVDYPKNGNKVVLADDIFSKKLIRRNPDWMAPEGEEESTAFYRSTRALGFLYQELVEAFPHSERMLQGSGNGLPPGLGDSNAPASSQTGSREDPISIVLQEEVQSLLSPGPTSIDPNDKDEHIVHLFNKYVDELQYICATHTISNTPGVRLRETEVVMGTLMTREDDPHDRLRNDCASRMRLHVGELVRDVKRYFQRDSSDGGDSDGKDREALLFRLERAWSCWNYSLRQKTPQGQCEFGAASFGLIALGSVLHCLKELSKI